MGKFDLFNKFSSAVLITNNNLEVIFTNNVFKRIFSDFENIKKFSHKLNYNVCALVSNDVSVHSPIIQAIKSIQDFSAYVTYQTSNNDYFYYEMTTTKKGNYTIIFLTDASAKHNLDDLIIKNQNFQKKISLLENENKNLSKIKLKAQSQAMKLLLLNNINNIIRESIDTNHILNAALAELSQMFGAFRAYYAEAVENDTFFKIIATLDDKDINKLITYDKNTSKFIFNEDVSILFKNAGVVTTVILLYSAKLFIVSK